MKGEDILKKLTDEDREFLKDLQEELLTQDHQLQADPRYWVIREMREESCWEDAAEYYSVFDSSDCCTVGKVDCRIDCNPPFDCVPMHEVEREVGGTLFLTLREAREHIAACSYRYNKPVTYAMTATESPIMARLIKILQETDWDEA